MITQMSEEEIKEACEALDVSHLAIDLLVRLYHCHDTQEDVDRVVGEFRQLLDNSLPKKQYISVHPTSIFTLADSLIHMLKDSELPADILDNDLFLVKNLIWSKASCPFLDVLVKSLVSSIPVNLPAIQPWKIATVAGIITEHEAFLNNCGFASPTMVELFNKSNASLLSRGTEYTLNTLMKEQGMGSLPTPFVRSALHDFNQILLTSGVRPNLPSLVNQLFKNVPGIQSGESEEQK